MGFICSFLSFRQGPPPPPPPPLHSHPLLQTAASWPDTVGASSSLWNPLLQTAASWADTVGASSSLWHHLLHNCSFLSWHCRSELFSVTPPATYLQLPELTLEERALLGVVVVDGDEVTGTDPQVTQAVVPQVKQVGRGVLLHETVQSCPVRVTVTSLWKWHREGTFYNLIEYYIRRL